MYASRRHCIKEYLSIWHVGHVLMSETTTTLQPKQTSVWAWYSAVHRLAWSTTHFGTPACHSVLCKVSHDWRLVRKLFWCIAFVNTICSVINRTLFMPYIQYFRTRPSRKALSLQTCFCPVLSTYSGFHWLLFLPLVWDVNKQKKTCMWSLVWVLSCNLICLSCHRWWNKANVSAFALSLFDQL